MNESKLSICGAVTLWSVARCDRAKLRASLAGLGLDSHLPEERKPKAILHDVLNANYRSADEKGNAMLVRPLAKKSAFTVVKETRGANSNEYTNELEVWIDEETGRVEASPSDDVDLIRALYLIAANELPAATVGNVLASIILSINGVALRPSGGVYWLPEKRMQIWSKVAAAIEQATVPGNDPKNPEKSDIYVLRTPPDADALRAIQAAITTQLGGEVYRLSEDVNSGELGVRALNARVEEAQSMRRRLAEYEAIIGSSQDIVRSQIDTLENAACQAALAAAARAASTEAA